MANRKLALLECISQVSPFEEQEADILWLELLENLNTNNSSLEDQKNLRQLLGGRSCFADCTWINK